MLDQAEIRRRIRAARILAEPTEAERAKRPDRSRNSPGITVPELAARMNAAGLGKDTLYAIEAGGARARDVRSHELPAIAAACDLPYEFFTADFAILSGAEGSDFADQLTRIESAVRLLLAANEIRPDADVVAELEDAIAEAQSAPRSRGRNAATGRG